MMFRLVGFLLWPIFWLTGKIVWYAAIALVKLMVFCFVLALRFLVVLFVGVPREIAKGAAAQKPARPSARPPSRSPSQQSATALRPVKPVPPARNMTPQGPPEEPVDVDLLVRQIKRRDRSQAAAEWYRMWDEALTPAQQIEKRALRLEHESGRPTSDHSFGLFPGDYIQDELDRQMMQGPAL